MKDIGWGGLGVKGEGFRMCIMEGHLLRSCLGSMDLSTPLLWAKLAMRLNMTSQLLLKAGHFRVRKIYYISLYTKQQKGIAALQLSTMRLSCKVQSLWKTEQQSRKKNQEQEVNVKAKWDVPNMSQVPKPATTQH